MVSGCCISEIPAIFIMIPANGIFHFPCHQRLLKILPSMLCMVINIRVWTDLPSHIIVPYHISAGMLYFAMSSLVNSMAPCNVASSKYQSLLVSALLPLFRTHISIPILFAFLRHSLSLCLGNHTSPNLWKWTISRSLKNRTGSHISGSVITRKMLS